MQQTTEPKIEQIIQQYRNKLQYLRRSPATVRNYLYTFTQFVQHHNGQVYNLTKQQVEQYVINLKCKTASTQNSVINAIKFYYERVLGKRKPGYYHIERPRREFKLPDILTPPEVQSLITALSNLKHRALLQLTYSCALRNSEVRNIRLHHIDWKASILKVVCAKGKRDRLIPIPAPTLELLKEYYIAYLHKKYNPNKLFFIGEKYLVYSPTSLKEIIKQACRKAKIYKHITPHTLRHSRATHWHNNSVSVVNISRLLGHRDVKTTQIYLHTGIDDLATAVKQADIRIMQTPHHTIEQKIDYLINRLATSPLILARP